MIYLRYLWYVLRHKWYVLLACIELGVPLRGLVHDLSKLRPSELVPYARYFYGGNSDIKRGRDETGYYKAGASDDDAFDRAWLYHQHRNPHHWQFWCLVQDDDASKCLLIPESYVREMVADWRGAGRAQGTPDTLAWYVAHRDNIVMHPSSRALVERLLGYGGCQNEE